MNYSKTGLAQLTQRFEGLRLVAYQDVRGIWTIGFGHTGPEVHCGLVWCKEKADAVLFEDTQRAVDCVNACVKVPLTQGEFDALVDFTFNIGCQAFKDSTMLKLLNAGDYNGAALQFARWVYAGGHVVAGLLKRREAEKAVFNA